MDILVHNLEVVLSHYKESFKKKEYNIESEEIDLLMEVFNISQIKKIENRQYWGRELGMCWQRLIVELFILGLLKNLKPTLKLYQMTAINLLCLYFAKTIYHKQ